MTTPQRIQLRRTKGFVLQFESMALNGLPAVKVTRPGKWGNHWSAYRADDGQWFAVRNSCEFHDVPDKSAAIAMCVAEHRKEFVAGLETYGVATALEELRGKNIACWCPLDSPCHGDVYLELANRPTKGK